MTLTSKRYLPAFTPTLTLAAPHRYCKPPSASDMRTLPLLLGMTFTVASSKLTSTGTFAFGLLSAGASVSSSFGSSGTAGAAEDDDCSTCMSTSAFTSSFWSSGSVLKQLSLGGTWSSAVALSRFVVFDLDCTSHTL